MHQKDKSSDSIVKIRQASNCCKRVFEAYKLACANKTKEPIPKSPIPPLFNGLEVLSSASDKAKLFPENFSQNSNLVDSVTSLPVFPSRTNLKLHNHN